MFEWLKNLFGFGSSSSKETATEMFLYKEIERLQKENNRIKEELDWYHYLGLPSHKLQEEGFDYYNFLKRKVEELEADKQYLIDTNIKASKKIQQLEGMEKLYLEEITRLKQKLTSMSLALNEDVATQVNKKKEVHKDEMNPILRANNRTLEEEIEEEIKEEVEERPLQRARRTLRGLRGNLSTYA